MKVDDAPARAHLSLEAWPLYARMDKADRAHSLRVFTWLQENGHDDPDLLTAALLHDNGKSATSLRVWHRTLKVLLIKASRRSWEKLSGSADPDSWRYPFYVLRTHARRGADWAEAAGCSETTVWLIRHHETFPDKDDPRYPLLRALQDADAVG